MRCLHGDLVDPAFDIPVDGGFRRRPSGAVQGNRQSTFARIEDKAVASDAGALRLDNTLHRDRRDRGIGSVAAGAKHIERGQRSPRVRARRHPVRRHRRRTSRNIEVAHHLSSAVPPISRRRNPHRQVWRLLGLMHRPRLPVNSRAGEKNTLWTEA